MQLIDMRRKLAPICVIMLLTAAFAEAAQFEGPGIESKRLTTPHLPVNNTTLPPPAQQNVTISAAVPSNDTDNTSLNVEIASDVYSDKDRRVLYCVRGNYVIVRNRIFITGPDVDKVKKVTYLLHPTFPNPVAVSEDRDSNFEIWIWCWGGFLIRASITTTTGQSIEKEYQFTFKEKFDDARSKGIPMIMTCNV